MSALADSWRRWHIVLRCTICGPLGLLFQCSIMKVFWTCFERSIRHFANSCPCSRTKLFVNFVSIYDLFTEFSKDSIERFWHVARRQGMQTPKDTWSPPFWYYHLLYCSDKSLRNLLCFTELNCDTSSKFGILTAIKVSFHKNGHVNGAVSPW